MIIKAEVEIEIDDADLERWLESHGEYDSRDNAVDEVEGMEFGETVAGLPMMIRFLNAKEAR